MEALTDLISNTGVSIVFLALLFLATLFFLSKSSRKQYKIPPGPFSLPLLGTLPFLGTDVREPLRRLSKDYGDIFTVYFGSRRVIVLNSYEAIKEAFVRQGNLLAGRPQDLFLMKEVQEGKGVLSSERKCWKENRKLTHIILRDFGVGSYFMESRIRAEARYFKNLMSDNVGTQWDPAYSIQAAVANVIYSICFEVRREYDDPWFIDYMRQLNRSCEIVGNANALTAFPLLKYLPGDMFGYKELMESVVYTREQLYLKKVKELMDTYQAGTTNDFIDAYLHVMYKEQPEGKDTSLCSEQLAMVISDLMGAGTETTTSTLRWGLVYILYDPDIQRKIQAEIDEVIGKEEPSMRHRQYMPYTEACLHELQRIGDVVPLGVPHSALEDMQLLGYDIPAGTMVVSNLYSVNYDPTLWPEPDVFNPHRFLDAEGKLHRSEKLIPFSMGKRVCLGESLARMELFLFYVTMLQHFRFELPEGGILPPKTGHVGITHMPKPFNVMVVPRT